jgi:hypothetical protein
LRHQGRPGWRERSRYQHAIHHDYRDAPLLAVVFDRGVRYFLQTHDKSAAGLSGAPQCDAILARCTVTGGVLSQPCHRSSEF